MERRSICYIRVYGALLSMAVFAAIGGPLTWTHILIFTSGWAVIDGLKEGWLRYRKSVVPTI